MALERLELPTFGLGNRCSVQLSYRAKQRNCNLQIGNCKKGHRRESIHVFRIVEPELR
jgi:hypothetical protein